MKKILIVVDSLNCGGTEIALINMLKFLSKFDNIEITILPLVRGGELEKDIPNSINIISIDEKKQKYLKPLRKSIVDNRLKNIGFVLALTKYIKKFNKLKLGERIRYNVIKTLDIEQKEYDIAIAYTDSSSLFYVSEKVNAKNKYVWVHMDYTEKSNRPMQHEYFYKKMDKIICVSKKAKESFDLLSPKMNEKTIVIYNLLDINRINKLKNEQVEEFDRNYFNIVSVGRLSKEKNFDTLINIFSDVGNKVEKRIRLYIIGTGQEKKKLQKKIKKLKLENSCFLLGKKSNPYKYMNKCDLYIQVSIREGFGMTLYEAKYLKKPILSTKVSAAQEILTNGKDAITVGQSDEKIRKALISIINDDVLRKKLIKNINSEIELIHNKQEIINLIEGEIN